MSTPERVHGFKKACFDNKKDYKVMDISDKDLDSYIYNYFQDNPEITGIFSTSHIMFYIINALTKLNRALAEDYELVCVDKLNYKINRYFEDKIPVILQDGCYNALQALCDNILYGTKLADIKVPLKKSII